MLFIFPFKLQIPYTPCLTQISDSLAIIYIIDSEQFTLITTSLPVFFRGHKGCIFFIFFLFNVGSTPSMEPSVGLKLTHDPEIESQMLNHLSYPGTPEIYPLKKT